MDVKSIYTECELRNIDQGYDPARAAETCAEAEGRFSDEQKRELSQDESRGDYWGDI